MVKSSTGIVGNEEPDFKSFYENSIDCLMYGGIDGYFKHVNRAFENLIGYTKEELLDIPFLDLVHPNDRDFAIEEVNKLAQGYATSGGNLRLITKSKVLKWLNWRAVPADDGSSFYAVARDVTAGMLKKQTRKRIAALVDTIPEVIIISSLEGQIKYMNRAGKDLLKIKDAAGMVDKTIFDLFVRESGRELKELYFPIFFDTGGVSGEFEFKIHDHDSSMMFDCTLLLLKEQNLDKSAYIGIFARPVANVHQLESERIKYHSMVDRAPIMVIHTDVDGNIRYGNEQFNQINGGKGMSRNILETIPTYYHAEFRNKLRQAVTNGTVGSMQIQRFDSGGKAYWYDCKLTPSFGLKGRIDGVNIFSIDITDQKVRESELETREEQLEIFIRHTPAAVAVFDLQMRYVAYSDNFLSLYGLGDKDLKGLLHYDVFPEIPDRWRQIHSQCLKGESAASRQDFYMNKEGKREYIKWEVHPWFTSSNEVGGMILFTELITDQILANERLKQKTEELKKTNSDLERFAYAASHDLKEPLRMVGNFVGLMNKKYSHLVDEAGVEILNYVNTGVRRMEMLINDLLDYSKLRDETSEHTYEDLLVIGKAAAGNLHPYQLRNALLSFSGSKSVVYCNPKDIQLVFEHLIANSIKFNGSEQPEVNITITLINGYWQVEVRDNGIGIHQRDQNKIFDIFQRLHSKSEFEGSGIGLSLCKKVIEKHHGKIWLKSDPGEGSSFYFTLPTTDLDDRQ